MRLGAGRAVKSDDNYETELFSKRKSEQRKVKWRIFAKEFIQMKNFSELVTDFQKNVKIGDESVAVSEIIRSCA